MIRVKTFPEEVWKVIPDLPFILQNLYEISNHGRVRNTKTGRIMKATILIGSDAWARVRLRKSFKLYGKQCVVADFMVYPHRMVYQLFGAPIPPKLHLYHINNDRSENGIWNLGLINKRNNRRRIARKRKEGWHLPARGVRYNHDRKRQMKVD